MGGLYVGGLYNRGGLGGVGGGGSGSGVAGGGPVTPVLPPLPALPPDLTNPTPSPVKVNLSSNPDPTMQWAANQMKARALGDMGAGRAIDVAGGKIREAGEGAQQALSANLSRRGVSGTGVEGLLRGRLEGQTQRGIAGAAADISTSAEAQRNAMLGNIAGVGGEMSAAQRAQEQLQLQAAQIDAENQRAAEAAADARRTAILGMLAGLA